MSDISASLLTALIAGLSRTFEEPSDEYPSTRCVLRRRLMSLLLGIRDSTADLAQFRRTGGQMLSALRSAEVIRPIPVEVVSPRWGPNRLWCIGLGITPDEITPPEMLQSMEPRGVLCYQSAIEVHGLSTQLPTHHHVARVTQAVPRSRQEATNALAVAAPPSIGRPLFRWLGHGFHRTMRDGQYLQAVESRRVQQFAVFRVTTLEQTLVDTMHRPGHCGGLDVVFECWVAAAARVDPKRLTDLVVAIGDPVLVRRVGWMMANVGVGGSAELATLRANAQLRDIHEDFPALFGGMPYDTADSHWGLRIP